MLRVKSVLVPTDHSRCADQALVLATDIARRAGAILHLLHVTSTPGTTAGGPLDKARTSELIQSLRLTEAGEGLTIVEVHRQTLKPGQVILDHATEIDADLIVLGSHEKGVMSESLIERVGIDVVRHADCPVITVRESVTPPLMSQVSNVLVPVDFSNFCRRALRKAAILARQEQATLHLLHVMERPLAPSFYATGVESAYSVDVDLSERCHDNLKALALAEVPDAPIVLHVEEGHPSDIICNFAARENCDLVFIATHGLTGMKRFFMGSVTEKVVRHAPCPVFIIKAFGKTLLSRAQEAKA